MLVSLELFKIWDQAYQPVQDLRGMNRWVETICPAVPNPYTLLSLLLPEHRVYTALDPFSIPLSKLNASLHLNELSLTWT